MIKIKEHSPDTRKLQHKDGSSAVLMPGVSPGVWCISPCSDVGCAHSRTVVLSSSRSIQQCSDRAWALMQQLCKVQPAVLHSGSQESRVLVVSDLSNLPRISSSSVVEPRLQIDSALQHVSALTVRESFSLAVSWVFKKILQQMTGIFHEIAVLMVLIVLTNLQSVRGGKI